MSAVEQIMQMIDMTLMARDDLDRVTFLRVPEWVYDQLVQELGILSYSTGNVVQLRPKIEGTTIVRGLK